jgi:hypothetical protein
MNTLNIILYNLVELIATIDPSSSGLLNMLIVNFSELSSATDPGIIFETLLVIFLLLIIYPITLLYRLFMGLIGQPVPVPWF